MAHLRGARSSAAAAQREQAPRSWPAVWRTCTRARVARSGTPNWLCQLAVQTAHNALRAYMCTESARARFESAQKNFFDAPPLRVATTPKHRVPVSLLQGFAQRLQAILHMPARSSPRFAGCRIRRVRTGFQQCRIAGCRIGLVEPLFRESSTRRRRAPPLATPVVADDDAPGLQVDEATRRVGAARQLFHPLLREDHGVQRLRLLARAEAAVDVARRRVGALHPHLHGRVGLDDRHAALL